MSEKDFDHDFLKESLKRDYKYYGIMHKFGMVLWIVSLILAVLFIGTEHMLENTVTKKIFTISLAVLLVLGISTMLYGKEIKKDAKKLFKTLYPTERIK